MIAVMAVSVTVALLLSEPAQRAETFALSLASVLIAEAAIFLAPLVIGTNGVEGIVPWRVGMSVLPVAYGAGVAFLAFLAARGMTWRPLVAAHLIWFILFLVVVVTVRRAGTIVAASKFEGERRNPLTALRVQFTPVYDSLRRLHASGDPRILNDAERLYDDLQSSSPSSTDGSAGVEAKIATSISNLDRLLGVEDGQTFDAQAFGAELQVARQLMRRRDDALANSLKT